MHKNDKFKNTRTLVTHVFNVFDPKLRKPLND